MGANGVAAGSGLASGAPCRSSEASKSSSSRGGGADTVPNIPVALDELPPAGWFEPDESGLSNGDLGASISGPPRLRKFGVSGFQDYIGLA